MVWSMAVQQLTPESTRDEVEQVLKEICKGDFDILMRTFHRSAEFAEGDAGKLWGVSVPKQNHVLRLNYGKNTVLELFPNCDIQFYLADLSDDEKRVLNDPPKAMGPDKKQYMRHKDARWYRAHVTELNKLSDLESAALLAAHERFIKEAQTRGKAGNQDKRYCPAATELIKDYSAQLPNTSTDAKEPPSYLLSDFEAERQRQVERALEEVKALTDAEREKLKVAVEVAKRRAVVISVFERDPRIVALRLIEANGKCEDCGDPAPFLRASNDTPYLEVHHVTSLAGGGDDSFINTKALCPNCHRKAHYGKAERGTAA